MKVPQYTIRNIPAPVDAYLRRRAKLSRKSLNQVIIDELSSKVTPGAITADKALASFRGRGMDDETLAVLAEDDIIQKELTRKQWLKDDN